MGICPWSPLAGGLLTGRYARDGSNKQAGRLHTMQGSGNPVFEKFNEQNWRVVDGLNAVAREAGRSPAQVALNWVANRPAVASTIIGATKMSQLEDNLTALDFTLPPELGQRLDEISQPPTLSPYVFFGEPFTTRINGPARIARTRGM
jgi:aryl-alcohol dehydrogenase-like predicted oxidoreductase